MEYKKKITETFISEINAMETGFYLLGIDVRLVNNELCFFESGNSEQIGDVLYDAKDSSLSFNVYDGKMTYYNFQDGEKVGHNFIFELNSEAERDNFDYLLHLSYNKRDSKLTEFSMMMKNFPSSYLLKRINIGDDLVIAEVQNYYDDFCLYNRRVSRALYYHGTGEIVGDNPNFYPLVEMEEFDGPTGIEHGNILYLNSSVAEVTRDYKDITIPLCLCDEQIEQLLKGIIHHPRNRELVNYVVRELSRQLPRIEGFLWNNFKLYRSIVTADHYLDSMTSTFVDFLVASATNRACGIAKIGEVNPIRIKTRR